MLLAYVLDVRLQHTFVCALMGSALSASAEHPNSRKLRSQKLGIPPVHSLTAGEAPPHAVCRRVQRAAQCSAYSWTRKAPEPTWADFMGTRLGRSPPLLDTGDCGSLSTQVSLGTLFLCDVYATTSNVQPAWQ